MKPTLDGVYAKVVRAYQKLDEFHGSLGDFMNRKPYVITVQEDPDPEMGQVCVGYKPFPPELPILVGEFAHNLRSALDHLIGQLVIDNGMTPDEDTAFPIFLSANNRQGNPRGPVLIRPGVANRVLSFVRSAQPYVTNPSDPSHEPLGALSLLNNVDKHRQLAVVYGAILHAAFRIKSPSLGEIAMGLADAEVVNNGAKLTTLLRTQLPSDMEVQVFGYPSICLDVDGTLITVVRQRAGDGLTQLINSVVGDVIMPLIEEFHTR